MKTFSHQEGKCQSCTSAFLSKILDRKIISSEQYNLCEAKILLDDIIKSISSQTNNKSSGNDGLTKE